MAKASTLARNIHENFLECGICFDRFKDPRGLPCLHAFCCQCLMNWSKSCSRDRSIIICPLCKKDFPIPEDGIQGFPVHFLVTNLGEAVDTDKQKTANKEKYCTKHEGEIKRFFCETCSDAICPDCCALDPAHKGHHFIRLEDAKNNYTIALKVFIDDYDDVQRQYSDAIRENETIKEELKQSIETVNEDLQQLKEHYLARFEATFEKHKTEVQSVWLQRSEELSKCTEALETSSVSLQAAYDRASDVIDSGSEYEIIAAYGAVSLASEQATDPFPAERIHVAFEADRFEITSVGRLTCDGGKNEESNDLIDLETDLYSITSSVTEDTTAFNQSVEKDASKRHPKREASNFDAGDSTNYTDKASTEELSSSPRGAYNLAFQPEPGDRLRPSLREVTREGYNAQNLPRKVEMSGFGVWKPSGYFKTTTAAERPKAIAIHANGDIAVTSRKSPLTVFSKSGDVKCIQKGSLCYANDIAVSAENQYIITGNNEIKVYQSKWFGTRRLYSFPTFNFNNRPESPITVAVDHNGMVIVGMHDGKTISIHESCGTTLSKMQTLHCPRRLAVNDNNELVVIFDNNTIQVLGQEGQVIHTIPSPPGVEWIPWYICCDKYGHLFVSNHGNPKAVFIYLYRDEEYRISDSFIKLDNNGVPYGLTVSRDGRELYVVDRPNNAVRKFQMH